MATHTDRPLNSQTKNQVNNDVYHELGESWYTAQNDPVALLRSEAKLLTPWVEEEIRKRFSREVNILDVGCGGGFHSNRLAKSGHVVTGIDLSQESLEVARRHDETGSVNYQRADAYTLPFENQSFDVVTCMDFLEHVEDPARVIEEISRVLKEGGLFFFHTFNRNPLSHLVVIKLVEWILEKTPENLHISRLFIKPEELVEKCRSKMLKTVDLRGMRPMIGRALAKSILKRRVDEEFSFIFTRSLAISYAGFAEKEGKKETG